MNRNMRMVGLIIAGVCLLTLLILLLKNTTQEKIVRNADGIAVRIGRVVRRDISIPIRTSGKLASKAEKRLSFKTGGIIESIFADEGQRVQKGQLLARLDPSEIMATVDQARTGVEKARRDWERVERLFGDNAVTLEQKQNVNSAYEIAKSMLTIAEFNLRHSAIYAPSHGRILKRLAETSELISPGMPVFLFGSAASKWVVRAGIADRDIVRIQLNDSAIISFDAHPGIQFPAVVSEIAGVADPMSSTFEVELELERSDQKLISGFVAEITLFPASKEKYALIPVEALIEGDGDRAYVFTIQPSVPIAKKIPVQIGHILDRQIAVKSGLEDVAEVITDGAVYLVDGSRIHLIH